MTHPNTKWCFCCDELVSGKYASCPFCGSRSISSAKAHIQKLQKANNDKRCIINRIKCACEESI